MLRCPICCMATHLVRTVSRIASDATEFPSASAWQPERIPGTNGANLYKQMESDTRIFKMRQDIFAAPRRT